MSMCFACGSKIKGTAERHEYFGSILNWHSKCWKRHKRNTEKELVTARAVTNESGQTYVDDETYLNKDFIPVRLVHAKSEED